jgi:hypothetical protein
VWIALNFIFLSLIRNMNWIPVNKNETKAYMMHIRQTNQRLLWLVTASSISFGLNYI